MKIRMNENKYYDNTKAQLENIFSKLDPGYDSYEANERSYNKEIPGLGRTYCASIYTDRDDDMVTIHLGGDYITGSSKAFIEISVNDFGEDDYYDSTKEEYTMPFDAPKMVEDANRLIKYGHLCNNIMDLNELLSGKIPRITEARERNYGRRNNQDLTRVPGTIAYVIAQNEAEFKKMTDDPRVRFPEYKEYILGLLNQADRNPSQQQAIQEVQETRSKNQLAVLAFGFKFVGQDRNNAVRW